MSSRQYAKHFFTLSLECLDLRPAVLELIIFSRFFYDRKILTFVNCVPILYLASPRQQVLKFEEAVIIFVHIRFFRFKLSFASEYDTSLHFPVFPTKFTSFTLKTVSDHVTLSVRRYTVFVKLAFYDAYFPVEFVQTRIISRCGKEQKKKLFLKDLLENFAQDLRRLSARV